MKPISATNRQEVAQVFLLGRSTREIADETGVSHGSVVNIIRELEAGDLNIPGATLDQFNCLRQLSLELRKEKLSTSQGLLGLQFFQRCHSLGIVPEQLDLWAGLVSKFASGELPQEAFLQAALRLHQLEESQGKTFETLAEEYEGTRERLAQIQAEVDSSAEEKKHLEKEIKSLSLQRDALAKRQQDLESRVQALAKRTKELKADVTGLEKDRAGMVRETRELKRRKTRLSSEVEGKEESLARLNDIGFRDEDLLRLRAIMDRMAADDGADVSQTREKLFVALASLRDLAQLDKNTEAQKAKLEQLAERKNLLEGEVAELQRRRNFLLGELSRAALSVTAEVKGVGEKAVSELGTQVEDLRGEFTALLADAMGVAGIIGQMEAEARKGEAAEKGLRDFIAEVKAASGRRR